MTRVARVRFLTGTMLAALAAGALAPVARANIIAATERPAGSGRTDLDLALYDVTTGARLNLPAGVNTTADELHPSITPDGHKLVFERSNGAAGTVRIVIVDPATGRSADLFSGFETSLLPPTSPAITPDGNTVLTGRPAPPGSAFEQLLTTTDVSSFPSVTTGPFPHTTFNGAQNGGSGGQTLEPVAGAEGLIAFEPRVPHLVATFGLGVLGSTGSCGLADNNADLSQPALAAGSSDVLLVVRRDLPGGAAQRGDVRFVLLNPTGQPCGRIGTYGALPAIVNTPRDESRPAQTPDGRYIGFIRDAATGHSRLFVWDSLTQLLVNDAGIDLGALSGREKDLLVQRGNLSLRTSFVLRATGVALSGLVSVQLLTQAGIGILVQRVVGHTRVLGRRAPRLRLIGRVPLGQFPRGRARIHWNRKVHGRRLAPGTYQITVRALARNGRVEDLGRPQQIRIR